MTDKVTSEAFGKRILEFRKERGWPQLDLGRNVGTSGAIIGRYERAEITPSIEALVKLAEALEILSDYLLLDHAPRRPLHLKDREFAERLEGFQQFSEEDRASLLHILGALLAKNRIKSLSQGLG